jgi:peptidoglycan hydrolase-like protein with peptidoglycan-binding domain
MTLRNLDRSHSMMTMKKCTIALAVTALAGGCSALGLNHSSSSGSTSQPQASSSASGGSSSGASSQVSLASSTIEQIQRTLNEKGYDAGPVDGNWGSQTQSALKDFQKAQGMQASGQPDKQTLAALGVSKNGSSATGGTSSAEGSSSGQSAAGGSSSTSEQGEAQQSNQQSDQQSNHQSSSGDRSAASGSSSQSASGSSQQQLNSATVREIQKSLNDSGFSAGKVDGVMGPHTQSALRNYQQAKGLKATGQPDPETLSALGVKEGASSASGGSSNQQGNEQGGAKQSQQNQ